MKWIHWTVALSVSLSGTPGRALHAHKSPHAPDPVPAYAVCLREGQFHLSRPERDVVIAFHRRRLELENRPPTSLPSEYRRLLSDFETAIVNQKLYPHLEPHVHRVSLIWRLREFADAEFPELQNYLHLQDRLITGRGFGEIPLRFVESHNRLAIAIQTRRGPGLEEWLKKRSVLQILYRLSESTLTVYEIEERLRLQSQMERRQWFRSVGQAILGLGLFFGALRASGPAVNLGSRLAGGLGEVAAGFGIGGAGGLGVAAMELSYETFSVAWMASRQRGTPYSCELLRQGEIVEENTLYHLFAGALLGTLAGGASTALALRFPRFTLYAMAAAVGVAQTYEIYQTGNHAYDSVRLYRLAEEAQHSGSTELAREFLREARQAAVRAGHHALEAAIIGVLVHSFLSGSEFLVALQQGGQAITRLVAMSSDEFPTAMESIAKAGGQFIDLAAATDPGLSPQLMQLMAQLSALKASLSSHGMISALQPEFEWTDDLMDIFD